MSHIQNCCISPESHIIPTSMSELLNVEKQSVERWLSVWLAIGSGSRGLCRSDRTSIISYCGVGRNAALMKGLSISFAFSYILCVVVCKRWNVSCWFIYSVICAGYSEADLSTYVRYEFPYPTVSIVEEFVYF